MNDVIFIVGMPRSGTTLLANILSSHSLICSGPETHLFSKISKCQYKKAFASKDWPMGIARLISKLELTNQNILSLYNHCESSFKDELKKNEKSYMGVIRALYAYNLNKTKKSIILEKTPNHICELEWIRTEFPESKIIRILRDPRDSANSMKKLNWTTDNSIDNAVLIEKWNRKVGNFFVSDSNSFEIKYEDLVLNFDPSIRRICNFLNIDYEEDLNQYYNTKDVVSTPNEEWKMDANKAIDSNLAFKWKSHENKEELLLIEKICFNYIKEQNYEFQKNVKNISNLSKLDAFPIVIASEVIQITRPQTIDFIPFIYRGLGILSIMRINTISLTMLITEFLKGEKVKVKFIRLNKL